MRYFFMAIVGVLNLQCSDKDINEQNNECGFDYPASFSSIEQLECGRGPEGENLCFWSLAFYAQTFDWFYSDIAEQGTYECVNQTIIATSNIGNQYEGTYNPQNQTLLWETVEYQLDE